MNLLTDETWGVLESLDKIHAVGHRVAQGGHYYKESVLIDDQVKENIEKLGVGSVTQSGQLAGYPGHRKLLPQARQVAVFDTAYHQTMPDYAYIYAIPYELYEKYNIRRYGFHGTSHKFVGRKACDLVGLDFDTSKVITCHLNNGSSITAIKNGKSADTSMGFTPLEGLIMRYSYGRYGPSIVTYLQERRLDSR